MAERLDERLALGVLLDGCGQPGELVEVGDFGFDGGAVGIGEWFGGFFLAPFLGSFVEGLVILVQFLFQRFGRFLLF